MFNYLYYYKTLYVLSHNATTPYDWNLPYGYCSTVCGLADLLLVKLILLLLLNQYVRAAQVFIVSALPQQPQANHCSENNWYYSQFRWELDFI